jgi:hypothetical protein
MQNVIKEYKLTVTKDICESAGYQSKPVHFKVGRVITLDEQIFNRLKSGEEIERYTQEGMITFDKSFFKKEVECIETVVTKKQITLK